MKRLIAPLMSAEPSSQGSMGRSKCVNKDDEEEEKRQAELCSARDLRLLSTSLWDAAGPNGVQLEKIPLEAWAS